MARAVGFAIGGGVALTVLFAAPAMAQDVVVQNANVVNAGGASANTGGNTATGNDSANIAINSQTANGFLGAANTSGGGGNKSNGTASITTGAATAVGNSSRTEIAQAADTGGAGFGPDVVVQDVNVINAGVANANTGGNTAVGNDSVNVAVNDQDATGLVAANVGGGGNSSDGTATIVTGAATAVGNQSATEITQLADTGDDGPFSIDVVVQPVTVIDFGIANADTGDNDATGNDSFNLALNFQDATGLLASNIGGGGNTSDGHASVMTGAATSTGNSSRTIVDQAADTGDDGPGLNIVFQNPFVLNAGWATAASGNNGATGNDSFNPFVNFQVVNGIVVANVVDLAGNASDGTALVSTGAALGTGNRSFTRVRQRV